MAEKLISSISSTPPERLTRLARLTWVNLASPCQPRKPPLAYRMSLVCLSFLVSYRYLLSHSLLKFPQVRFPVLLASILYAFRQTQGLPHQQERIKKRMLLTH